MPQAGHLYTHLDAASAGEICEVVRAMDGFEIVTEPILSLFSFRCSSDDATRQRLVDAINDAMHVARAWGSKSYRHLRVGTALGASKSPSMIAPALE